MKSFKQFSNDPKLIEAFSNWGKAYKIHSKIENGMGNKAWKARHVLAAIGTSSIVGAIASKDYGMAAMTTGIYGNLAKDHINDIVKIKKKLDDSDAREKQRKEYETHMAAYHAANPPKKKRAPRKKVIKA